GQSFVLTLILLGILFLFYGRILQSSGQAFLALTLFLTSGGLGWWYFVLDWMKNPTLETLKFPPQEYTHIGSEVIEWINVVTAQLVPQRAFLLGLPIMLAILLLLLRYSEQGWSVERWKIVLLGILSGLMLIIHAHSFIVLVLICSFWMMMDRKKSPWLLFALSAAFPSAVLYSLFYGQSVEQGFLSWYPGWLAHPLSKNVNWFWFWIWNWGIFLPFALIASFKTGLYRHPLVASGIVLFLVSNLVLFQPYDWDNSKILTWSYLLLCLPAARGLVCLWSKKNLMKVIVIGLFFTMTASGFLDLWRLLQTDQLALQMWSKEEIELARQFRSISNPTDRVLTSDQHNHWVSTLTGHPVMLGYKGWMWTYGIDYTSVDADMQTMFAGRESSKELLLQYNIKYVIIGPSERSSYNANEEFFERSYRNVLESDSYRVYEVASP
ncbi:MAG: hypothetical protein Q8R11_01490, partial [bacterium]|nr:hypothetical protein [bacterium]